MCFTHFFNEEKSKIYIHMNLLKNSIACGKVQYLSVHEILRHQIITSYKLYTNVYRYI